MLPKRAKTEDAAPLSLPALPPQLFSLVMEFLFFGYTSDLWPTKRAPAWKGLKDLAVISKSWLIPVQLLTQQFQRETFKIQLKAGTQEEFDNIYSEISLRGEDVRDLRVEIGEGKKYSYGKLKFLLPTKATEEMEVDWDALLEKFGECERLDLELVPLESKHLPKILRAAGQRCLHLESLVLPRKANLKKVMQGEHIDSVITELYGTLEKLYVKGGRGGLRQLTVPTRNDGERHRSSTEFLENVARFCPNVEYLDGAGKAIELYDYVKCADQWMVSLETWELFNKTCTKLREFHWTVAPFADPFFEVFGAYSKPNLKKLTISANLWWSWEEYRLKCCDTTSKAIKNRHGQYASNIAAVFKGCPSLINLKVEIDLPNYALSPVDPFDIGMYGDWFCQAVATHCPLLEQFAIRYVGGVKELINNFTDTGLLKLAELKHLRLTESNLPVVCSGDGIFEFMHRVLTSNCCAGDSLELDLRIGGEDDFYSVVVAFLRRLAAISEEDFGAAANKRKYEVYLVNPYTSTWDEEESAEYIREELRPLLERVKEVHPSLRTTTDFVGRSGDSFRRMTMFTLSWRPESRINEFPLFW